MDGEPVRALEDDLRHVGQRLDVVQARRLIEQAAVGGMDVLGARLPHPALDGGHQRRRLAAHERAGAAHDLDIEAVAGAQDVLAQQAVLAGRLDGQVQVLHRQRVLIAHVDKALMAADRVRGDDHALDDRVRISLHQGAIHERAGVTLIAVGDDVLDVALGLAGGLPLAARRVACAPAAAQAGLLDLGDHLVGGHAGEHLAQRLVPADRDVLVNRLRVNLAAVAQDDAHLLGIEGQVFVLGDRLAARSLFVGQPLDEATLDQGLLDQLGHVGRLDACVEVAFGPHGDHRSGGTKAAAAGLDDAHFVAQAPALDLILESRDQLGRPAVAAAYQDVSAV